MLEGLRVSTFLAGRALRRGNKGTLLLTVMIIALVFVNLVFLPSIVQGVVVSFNRQSIDYNYGNLDVEPREGEFYIENADALVRKLERIPGVVAAAPRITAGAAVTFKTETLSRSVIGVSPPDETRVTLTASRMIEGEYLSAGDTGSAVIGKTLAGEEDERLDQLESLGGVRVGDSITVAYSNGQARRYHVKGIFQTDSFSADSAVYVTRTELASVLGLEDQVSQVLVRTATEGDEEAFRNRLYSFGVQEKVSTWQEKSRGILGDVTTSFGIINLISTGVSLVIAVVVIFIVVFINTVNRRRQIGILKAIGIDQGLIVNSYVLQVVFISMVGMGLGLALLGIVTQLLTAYPLRFPGGPVYPAVEAAQILQSMASLFIVSVVAGYVPAWRTASEEILSAIRG
jgi:putative ABC transport system permease protein